MNFLLRCILLLFINNAFAQDTLFTCDAYRAYYSFELKAPIYVIYKLYKGGGDCDRSKYRFTNDSLGNQTANAKDYFCSGYDMGHLANAEDFAYDCTLDESTFRFWNCFPQTPELNRGPWKAFENEIRKLSQEDSLTVICGGLYRSKTIGNGVYIPKKCWKVVYSSRQNKIVSSFIFINRKNPIKKSITIHRLNRLLNRKFKKINLHNIIKNDRL